MSATTYGWLVLAFPLAGTVVISLGWRVLPGRLPGWIASAAILLSFIASIGALLDLQDHAEDDRQLVDSLWTYASTADFNVDLWICDLAGPDPTYVLPILMGITMFIQQKMTPTTGDPAQARMMLFMPVVFTLMFLIYPIASGLALYWAVSNVLQIGQQWLMERSNRPAEAGREAKNGARREAKNASRS